jgi:hypothetical protein
MSAAIVAPVDAVTLAVQPTIDSITFPVQPPIDAIALAIEPVSATVPAVRGCTVGASIEAAVDLVAPLVEALFDTVAPLVEAVLDAVSRIGESVARQQQKPCNTDDEFSRIHDGSPGIHTNVVCSGVLTDRRQFG